MRKMTIEGGDNPRKPKVVVVSSTASAPLAAPEILADAQEFADGIWQTLGIPPEQGFNRDNFRAVATALDLRPVAFVYIRDLQHWNLVTFADGGPRSRTFDPRIGLTEIDNKLVTSTYLLDIFGKWDRFDDPRRLFTVNYELPEYNLNGIGKVQVRPYDCGPMCLWAAKKALGK